MTAPTIVVLEDSPERVEWLTSEFSLVDVRWTKTVDEFFEVLRLIDRTALRLILLDHDLGDPPGPLPGNAISGPGTWPYDAEEKNGMHAVDGLDGWSDIPVIVWSINSVRAPVMVSVLQKKGFVVGWIPFSGSSGWRLRAAISSQVEGD